MTAIAVAVGCFVRERMPSCLSDCARIQDSGAVPCSHRRLLLYRRNDGIGEHLQANVSLFLCKRFGLKNDVAQARQFTVREYVVDLH
jgi:hypothetical protein